MAATVDNRPTSSKPNWQQVGEMRRYEIDVDFTETANQLAQNETMALLDIEADKRVHALIKVVTADTDITDVDLGLSSAGATAADLADGVTFASAAYVENATLLYVNTSEAKQLVLTNKDAQTINQAVIKVICFVEPLV